MVNCLLCGLLEVVQLNTPLIAQFDVVLQVGTLDTLIGLTDDLGKLDSYCEA